MKTYTFPYYVSFGRNDSVDCAIDCEINDKQAKKLEHSAKESGRFRLDEDDDLQDVYDRVYKAIIQHESELLSYDPSPVKDSLSWEDDYDESVPVSAEQISAYLDNLTIGINFPFELQMLEPTAKKRIRKAIYEPIVLSREEAIELVKDSGKVDKIVYVDQGKTLFFVPIKYSGTFVIPTGVSRIEKNTFYKRKKITELIIEDGLYEIPEWAFEGCDSLEKVTISPSVKTICYNAFTKCSKLREVNLSEGLVEIDNTAFRFCSDLEELHIPATVKEISAFINDYFNGLKHIYFEGMETSVNFDKGGNWSRMTMHVKRGSLAEEIAIEKAIKYIYY